MVSPGIVQKLLCILKCCYVAIAFSSGRRGLRRGQSLIRQSKSMTEKKTSSESRGRRILLVEDEGDLRSAIGKFLAKNGYFVTGVSDARSAILVCRGIVRPVPSGSSSGYRYKFDPNFAHHTDGENLTNSSTTQNHSTQIPDCVVLDIQLVGSMNGLGLLKIIRSDPMLASLPVVLLTAKGKVEDRIVGYEHGADAYLPKPFDPDELVSIVNGLLLRDKISRPSNMNTKNIAVYGDLKRELMEVKALLSLDAPPRSAKSEISADSLRRDILEIKDAIKGNTEIISLVARGKSNKDIANELECSVSKVEKHVTAMFKKANVNKRADLVSWWGEYSKDMKNMDAKVDVDASGSRLDKEAPDEVAQVESRPSPSLTKAERVVMELLERGLTTEEIISTTQSTKRRISEQLDSLKRKARVKNRTELIRWWIDSEKGKREGNSSIG
ncbi:hypothetical protein ACHAW5_005131 [Stephanodiscus triporus]|uniref:Response regulatory domain-containing protein n=1 Tax=Stephanodiscus triporus TaxID=2934178 RepID=A0ABD3MJX4_9STRA